FETHTAWVNKGASWIRGGDVCFDQRGRHCACGADFARARDEEAFPVEIYQRIPDIRSRKGADPAEWPEDLRVREWPEVRA
ncbi:MAG: hypothetical protein ABIK89_02460, partial [Planctomycetota bacterium]